ncbi:MAG: alpha/beta hydrolase [Gammaproteobacteria bacterium]|nr:alpha/beta hydrolase [Gammaproteobacteria bacterium]
MNKSIRKLVISLLLFLPALAIADIAVLVHGYHSSGKTWRANGITHILASKGWYDAGYFTPSGPYLYDNQVPLNSHGKFLITAELPSEASVDRQAELLSHYLNQITNNFPNQKIHLIAHSAGGLVARLSLVNNYNNESIKKYNITQLITIATPHLGSPIANMAEKASDTPIGFFAPIFGANEINRAERLYKQMGNEDKNRFLFWLNRQTHPPMLYTSIVRADGSILNGDWLVPPKSQNMANVPAIGPNAQVFLTQGVHHLRYYDGLVLLKLLP